MNIFVNSLMMEHVYFETGKTKSAKKAAFFPVISNNTNLRFSIMILI